MSEALNVFKQTLADAKATLDLELKQELQLAQNNAQMQRIIQEKQQEADQYAANFQEDFQNQLKMNQQIQGEMFAKKAQIPKEIQEIVDTLIAQPVMLPVVQNLLKKVASDLSAAIDSTLAKYE